MPEHKVSYSCSRNTHLGLQAKVPEAEHTPEGQFPHMKTACLHPKRRVNGEG